MIKKALTSTYKPLGRNTGFYPLNGAVPDRPSDHVGLYKAYPTDELPDGHYGLTIENTNKVAQWRDSQLRLGFGNSDNGSRPFYDETHVTPNGKKSVFFNGGKFVNRVASSSDDFISSNGQTIIIVGGNFTNDADTIIAKYNASSGERQWRVGTDRYIVSTLAGTFDTDEQANDDHPTGWNVIMFRWNPGVETAIYLNGSTTPLVSAVSPASTYETVDIITRIGTDSNGGTSINEGELTEIGIFNRPLTNIEWVNYNLAARAEWIL